MDQKNQREDIIFIQQIQNRETHTLHWIVSNLPAEEKLGDGLSKCRLLTSRALFISVGAAVIRTELITYILPDSSESGFDGSQPMELGTLIRALNPTAALKYFSTRSHGLKRKEA